MKSWPTTSPFASSATSRPRREGGSDSGSGPGTPNPFASGDADVGFVCAPSYQWMARTPEPPVERGLSAEDCFATFTASGSHRRSPGDDDRRHSRRRRHRRQRVDAARTLGVALPVSPVCTLGPFPIQPIVVRRGLELRSSICEALLDHAPGYRRSPPAALRRRALRTSGHHVLSEGSFTGALSLDGECSARRGTTLGCTHVDPRQRTRSALRRG